MELELKYKSSEDLKEAQAFFISGKDFFDCLETIKFVGVSDTSQLFAVPRSISSNEFQGVLVVLERAMQLNEFLLRCTPLIKIGGKLFLPANAEIYPPLEPDELDQLLLYKTQLFLPQSGLIGFDDEDAIDLVKFIRPPSKKASIHWNRAKEGNKVPPYIQRISLKPMTEDELKEQMESLIQKKPLSEIPEVEKEKTSKKQLKKSLNSVKRGLFKGMIKMINKIPANNSPYGGNYNNAPGLLDRMENWLVKQMNDLEKERDSELNRLMDLFKNDPDEALKYAIPLDSNYLSRGEGRPNSKLGRRNTSFDVSNLGGGRYGDTWDIGSYYQKLRSNYVDSARDAKSKGDHKKAAYIYANLLNDYHAAAEALKEGSHFIEAATLYKEHLKNKQKAAECYEQGKLYAEAIELQLEFEAYEKVGDLYRLSGNNKKEKFFYERACHQLIDQKNYFEAARVAKDKKKDFDESQKYLLSGWENGTNSEDCLDQYFRNKEEREEEIATEIQHLYSAEYHLGKEIKFLNVIKKWNATNLSVKSVNLRIAQEILAKQAKKGNIKDLRIYGDFIPEDKFIKSDIGRFITRSSNFSLQRNKQHVIQLTQKIEWLEMVNVGRELCLLGIKEKVIILARINIYGDINYITCAGPTYHSQGIKLISDFMINDTVLMLSPGLLNKGNYLFDKNKYFGNKLIVYQTQWLPTGALTCCIAEDSGIASIESLNGILTLREYSAQGEILETIQCTFLDDIGERNPVYIPGVPVVQTFYWRNGYYHLMLNGMYCRIRPNGETLTIPTLDTSIIITPSNFSESNLLAFITGSNYLMLLKEEETTVEKEVLLYELDQNENYMAPVWLDRENILIYNRLEILICEINSKTIRSWSNNIVKNIPIVKINSGLKIGEISILYENGQIEFAQLEIST